MTILPKSRTIPASDIAGARPIEQNRPRQRPRVPSGVRELTLPLRSLGAKLVGLLIVLISVPIIIYAQFLDADREKQTLLLQSVQEQGRLIGQALLPLLSFPDSDLPLDRLRQELARVASGHANVTVLFRPEDQPGGEGFFYVASHPSVSNPELSRERARLLEQGVLGRLSESCSGDEPLALRYTTPEGGDEFLTSITPVNTGQGCWAVITSHSASVFLGESIGQPFWTRPEIRLAALIYVVMVVITLTILIAVWRSINRFGQLAREIRRKGESGSRFADQNRMPELASVAEDFDRLVSALQESSHNIRRAAEENAHALKTPIAIIRQSMEPLKRNVGQSTERGTRALAMIEKSVDRLDALVSSARRMDEAAADLVDPPAREIDLSSLLRGIVNGYREVLSARDLELVTDIDDGIVVVAGADLLETVIENILDNAISFSPPGARLSVGLRRISGEVELVIEDEGPGIEADGLSRIFERYYSSRPAGGAEEEESEDAHYGIGLWIVNRNVTAVGGCVNAENRPEGGLRVSAVFPLRRSGSGVSRF
jgi:two-component system sensor histidine kinase ChvG